MDYKILGRTGAKVSEVGLGGEHLITPDGVVDDANTHAVINAALDAGVNIIDVFMPQDNIRKCIGDALGTRRKDVLLQGHLGACLDESGQYKKNTALDEVEKYFSRFMSLMNTDYVDIGMLHFVDSEEDYKNYIEGGVLDYALSLKKKGIIRYIGMSSHVPQTALKAVNTDQIDVLMFSLNPVFDMYPSDTDIDSLFDGKSFGNLSGLDPSRNALYLACESHGTAITVMKTLGAGMLLNGERSPFKAAMTVPQLVNYALSRPAVASALIGCRNVDEVKAAVAYSASTAEERDYMNVIGGFDPLKATGHCMYCNHCLPCPNNIDIAAVTKYLDLARSSVTGGLDTLKAHYAALKANAKDCIECGACEARCPFSVSVTKNMQAALEVFN